MKICNNCNRIVEDDSHFCNYCGESDFRIVHEISDEEMEKLKKNEERQRKVLLITIIVVSLYLFGTSIFLAELLVNSHI